MSTLDGFSTTLLTPSLGSLLHEYRTASGDSAKTVSRRSALSVVEIAQVEIGRAELDVDQLADAVGAYAVPRSLFPPHRCQVNVDLNAGLVSVYEADGEVAESPADSILLAYFELFFTARSMLSTSAVPFTDLDLDVLRVVLSSRRGEVTSHLQRIVGPLDEPFVLPAEVTRRTARRALLVLAAAATTFAGGIVVRQSISSSPPADASIEVQIIDAVVITR
ncbi:MAG: helix-turn-helix transcriptional regulator [Acidimicrobiales bacterium]